MRVSMKPLYRPFIALKNNPILSFTTFLFSKTTQFSLSFHFKHRKPLFHTISLIINTNMAQKRENEETELKVPETLTLCTTPIPTPPKLSGKDYSTSRSARSPDSSDSPADELIPTPPKVCGAVDPRSSSASSPDKSDLRGPPLAAVEEDRSKRRYVNRCSGCRRKVGLTGFRCRCGELFCSEHRYSDRHDCSFDYKTAGREAIARENPVVRASKILKV